MAFSSTVIRPAHRLQPHRKAIWNLGSSSCNCIRCLLSMTVMSFCQGGEVFEEQLVAGLADREEWAGPQGGLLQAVVALGSAIPGEPSNQFPSVSVVFEGDVRAEAFIDHGDVGALLKKRTGRGHDLFLEGCRLLLEAASVGAARCQGAMYMHRGGEV